MKGARARDRAPHKGLSNKMGNRPIRTCVGCRRQRDRAELIRVARRPDGTVAADPEGRSPGRGAYLCRNERCVAEALSSGRLGRALGHEGRLPEELGQRLLQEAER